MSLSCLHLKTARENTVKYYVFCSVTDRWDSNNAMRTLFSNTVRARVMRSLISPLKGIANAFLNGQLVAPSQNACLSCIFLVKLPK